MSGFRLNDGEIQCEETLEDGTACLFVGRPADVGVHKYYKHGKCNPIKAIVVSNVCPGCNITLASLKSAKEHANRSWKRGICTERNVSRPYSHLYEVQNPTLPLTCNLCKTLLTTLDEVQIHMRTHFQTLVPGQFQAPPNPPDPPPSLPGGGVNPRPCEPAPLGRTSPLGRTRPLGITSPPRENQLGRTSPPRENQPHDECSRVEAPDCNPRPSSSHEGSASNSRQQATWKDRRFPKRDPRQTSLDATLFGRRPPEP